MPTVTYRKVACVIHQVHSSCLPETLRCIGKHSGLQWAQRVSTCCVRKTQFLQQNTVVNFFPDAASKQDNNLQLRKTVSSNRFHFGQYYTRRIRAGEELRLKGRSGASKKNRLHLYGKRASASSAAEFIPRVKTSQFAGSTTQAAKQDSLLTSVK